LDPKKKRMRPGARMKNILSFDQSRAEENEEEEE
jgi:hypothetical protein